MRLAILIALAGCAGAEAAAPHRSATTTEAPPAPLDGTLGLVPGESMSYDVHLGGLVAGEAAIAVGVAGDWKGHHAIVVKSRAATAGAVDLVKHVIDEATTVIDLDTGRPLQLDTYVEIDGKHATATATFTESRADITYQKEGDQPHTQHVDFAREAVFDTHAAMGQIRGWHAAPGTTKSVFVVGGRRLWRVDMTYVGEGDVGSVLGNRHAVRLDGKSFRARANRTSEDKTPTRTFSVWLSDDADRVPLKVVAHTELGDVTMDLTDYTRP